MRIAIIGAGISGLTAAWKLSRQYSLTVFEAGSYVGGHTNTISVEEDGRQFGVDTGFIVFNRKTYPNFCGMLQTLEVDSQPTEMTFSVSCERTGLEYRGADPNGLFAQRTNLVRPGFWRMLRDWNRFNRLAVEHLEAGDLQLTVREFFEKNSFSAQFRGHYFYPMACAVWSCPTHRIEEFPIAFIMKFYRNHGLLGVRGRPQWRVIQGGSREYVKPLIRPFESSIRLNCPVQKVERHASGVDLIVAGEKLAFDHVIFACHSDQALRILGNEATPLERELLGCFPYESNRAILHTDYSVLPRRRRAWASWNYRLARQESRKATVTYNMNILQGLSAKRTYCVTLNDSGGIREDTIIREIEYHHPVFTLDREKAQQRHHELIGPNHTSYCGAYWRNGFHEDGVVSALTVCENLRSLVCV